jgi:transposase InsO family protein
VLVDERVESGEHVIEQGNDLLGRQSLGEWGEVDDVGEEHRRVGEPVGDDCFVLLEPGRDRRGQHVQQQSLAARVGMVYVAFVVDVFSRRIVGWRAATRMTTDLVLDALEHALFTRAREGVSDLTGLISHSDAGSQYTSVALTRRLLDEGIDPSVGSVGDALDNALAETTVGSFKNELIRRQGPWHDVDHVELGIAQWVAWSTPNAPTSTSTTSHRRPSSSFTTLASTPYRRQGEPTSEVSGHAGAGQWGLSVGHQRGPGTGR